jgi:hypothetical protein
MMGGSGEPCIDCNLFTKVVFRLNVTLKKREQWIPLSIAATLEKGHV